MIKRLILRISNVVRLLLLVLAKISWIMSLVGRFHIVVIIVADLVAEMK